MKNETRYIGIRGYRGSGKNTIAFLLGNIIQYIIDEHKDRVPSSTEMLDNNIFNMIYRIWCEKIKSNERDALDNMNTDNVYLETFGNTPKMLVELLTNIPHDYFDSDYHKDHVIVRLKDFTWEIVDTPEHYTSLDHERLMSEIEHGDITIDENDIVLTLRELVVYFATVSMKYLGRSVWVKSARCSEQEYDDFDSYYNIGTRYKIFTDIKAPSEINYIKEHDGKIIILERPEFKKQNKGVELLDSDDRWDFKLRIEKDILEDSKLKKNLVTVALALIEQKQ